MDKANIAIVGAGLSGSLLAALMGRRGYSVDVYEWRPDPRKHNAHGGRSINLALSTRGISALKRAGAWELMKDQLTPMRGRQLHDQNGALTFQPYSVREDEVIYSVSRGELNVRLISHADTFENVTFHFGARVLDVDLDERRLKLEDHDEPKAFDHVLAADGAGSIVRRKMQERGVCTTQEDMLTHDYKELTIPSKDGAYQMQAHALHIWPRRSFMFIALPNLDGSFTCTLFLPKAGKVSFASLTSDEAVDGLFREVFPDAHALLPDLTEQYAENPQSHLGTIRCSHWFEANRALILGDAAHAVVPFFGQGMNASFEDCEVFDALLEERGELDAPLFEAFERARIENANAIADMALENFVEMRDHVADEAFLLRKEVERELRTRFADRYMSRYSLVTFSTVPYAEAKAQGEANEKLLDQLCRDAEALEDIDWSLAESLLNS